MSITLDDRQRRELWGMALTALAILLTLSFVPPTLFGAAGSRVFSTGNIVGVLGREMSAGAYALFGLPALLLPAFPLLWGLVAFERMGSGPALRWSALLGGGSLLFATGTAVVARGVQADATAAGWMGTALGDPLATLLGGVGGTLVLCVLFAALCIVTIGWNPLRTVVGGGRLAWSHAGKTVAGIPELLPKRPAIPSFGRGPRDEREDDDEAEPEDEELADDEEDHTVGWQLPEETVFGGDAPDPRRDDTDPFPPLRPSPLAAKPAAAAAPTKARQPAARPKTVRDEQTDLLPEDSGDPFSQDLPSTALLVAPPARDEARNRHELDKLGQVLVDKLATFKIEGEIIGMTAGPVVTQFEVAPAPGVKVARIASLDADLALAMKAPSIRIVAPIPGKGAVGVEVPNPTPEMVFFRETIESPQFRGSKALLPLALGKDIAGRPYVADLAKMPHLLIAGATGSGKSVCVNTIITSLIFRHTPQTLRFLMVDPKMVELSVYNDIPHLRHPVVTDNNDAATVLKWAVLEMERRYELLSVNGVRNLQDFNKRVESGGILRSPEADGDEGDPDRWIYKGGALPYIVVIIDELADLMMTVQGDVEKPLALLAQKARAIGIHLILATQRPSVNVITGLIKANFPSRIAFRVSSKVDSRTILDQNGADNLLGNGDMLLLPPASSEAVRIQGAYLSTEETEQLMNWYREVTRLRRELALAEGRDPDEQARREANILDEVRSKEDDGSDDEEQEAVGDRDALFREAAELCIQHQGGSTSLLQRRLRIGYGRAARVIDQLHFAGVLGPPDGSKPREVLIDHVQLDRICTD
ncbi:MAG: DNA translocase FtsK 4TM domain-containing protein [Gemmatimonadetes bacterium]|nr:DNA translocase FtsK 4TM domain-containing protein [Gemmatimonadota bacterium]